MRAPFSKKRDGFVYPTFPLKPLHDTAQQV